MAISDKLNYLIETKSQLKDMINYGLPTENQITNETTFRNYVKSIFEAFLESLRDSTTLYTNLPKISGNGTQITLNDTANAPMRITLKASELSQDGTPTPSTPQDIHTISGSNKVVVSDGNGNSQEANIDLGNIEYCKIGDYEDRIFKNVVGDTDYSSERDNGGWYLKKNIGKVVLDGSESWNERTNSGGTKQFYVSTNLPVSSVLDATQICTHFNKYRQTLFNYGAVGEFAILTNTRVFYGGVEDTLLLEDFKTSLASNNLIVYYILATPTYTLLNDTLQEQLNNIYKKLLSYKGTTNVSQINNDLPFVLGVSALEDLS